MLLTPRFSGVIVFEIPYTVFKFVNYWPAVLFEPCWVEEGATNENYHIIDIHWIHITETQVAAAHNIYNWQYKHFHWRCFTFDLFHRNLILLFRKHSLLNLLFFVQARWCRTSFSCVTIVFEFNGRDQSNFLFFFTYSINVPNPTHITPK